MSLKEIVFRQPTPGPLYLCSKQARLGSLAMILQIVTFFFMSTLAYAMQRWFALKEKVEKNLPLLVRRFSLGLWSLGQLSKTIQVVKGMISSRCSAGGRGL